MLQLESLIIQHIYQSIFASPCPLLKGQSWAAAARLAQGFHSAARLNFVSLRARGNCWREVRNDWRTGMDSRSRALLSLLLSMCRNPDPPPTAQITKALEFTTSNHLHLTVTVGFTPFLKGWTKPQAHSPSFALSHLQDREKWSENKHISRLLLNGGHCS